MTNVKAPFCFETQGPCGSVRTCDVDTVTDDTCAQVKDVTPVAGSALFVAVVVVVVEVVVARVVVVVLVEKVVEAVAAVAVAVAIAVAAAVAVAVGVAVAVAALVVSDTCFDVRCVWPQRHDDATVRTLQKHVPDQHWESDSQVTRVSDTGAPKKITRVPDQTPAHQKCQSTLKKHGQQTGCLSPS